MVKIKYFIMPTMCSKCIIETYDWETGEHSCKINNMVTESDRETERSEYCPLVECDENERCNSADKLPDGKCKGYQRSRFDDEPSELCKDCKKFELYGIE